MAIGDHFNPVKHFYDHFNRFVEEEHLSNCAPETIASGLEKLPLLYTYKKDGTPNTDNPTTQELPTREKLQGKDTYKKLMRFFTTFDITPEQLREKGVKRLNGLYEEVTCINKDLIFKSTLFTIFWSYRSDTAKKKTKNWAYF